MVTKKRRRRQLARASAQRQGVRRAERAAHRRRRNIALTAVLALLAVAALVAWIVTHPSDDVSSHADGSAWTAQVSAQPSVTQNMLGVR